MWLRWIRNFWNMMIYHFYSSTRGPCTWYPGVKHFHISGQPLYQKFSKHSSNYPGCMKDLNIIDRGYSIPRATWSPYQRLDLHPNLTVFQSKWFQGKMHSSYSTYQYDTGLRFQLFYFHYLANFALDVWRKDSLYINIDHWLCSFCIGWPFTWVEVSLFLKGQSFPRLMHYQRLVALAYSARQYFSFSIEEPWQFHSDYWYLYSKIDHCLLPLKFDWGIQIMLILSFSFLIL